MVRNSSVITRIDWSPAKLFWASVFFFAILQMLTYAKFGALITIIPDALFLILLVDSIVTKIRNVRRARKDTSQSDYDNLIKALNQVKHGSSSKEDKKRVSIKLIQTPGLLSEEDRAHLIAQTKKVYED